MTSSYAIVSGSVNGNFNFSMKIEKFSTHRDSFIKSGPFRIQSDSSEFYFIIYLDEGDSESKESVSVYLANNGNNDMLIKWHSASFSDENGKVLWSLKSSKWMEYAKKLQRGYRLGIKRDALVKQLIDDILIFSANISYCSTSSEKYRYSFEMCPRSKLIGDLEDLLKTKRDADVAITAGDEKIAVHSAILRARSKVFATMLQTDMAKKTDKIIEITDFSKDTINKFLEFVYKAEVDDMNIDIALELLHAGDMYGIENLKQYCTNYLLPNITDENVIRILIHADMYHADNLRAEGIRYFCGSSSRTEILDEHEKELNNFDLLRLMLRGSITKAISNFTSSIPSICSLIFSPHCISLELLVQFADGLKLYRIADLPAEH